MRTPFRVAGQVAALAGAVSYSLTALPLVAGEGPVDPGPVFTYEHSGVDSGPVFVPDISGVTPSNRPPAAEAASLELSETSTTRIVADIQLAQNFCALIPQSEYVVDCLADQFRQIAASLPEEGDYASARSTIDQAASELEALVAANPSRTLNPGTPRSETPLPRASSRPLRPVATEAVPAVLVAAAGIVEETGTILLRSAPPSDDAAHYQRIAAAVGSTTLLLRSL